MKSMVISILVAALLIAGAIMLASSAARGTAGTAENVSVRDGTQIVEITAKGKYKPQVSLAKANMPTVLKVKTNGTYDCTSSLIVRAIGYRAVLPPSGETLIEIPPQKPGSIVKGVCAMGMYNFQVKFN